MLPSTVIDLTADDSNEDSDNTIISDDDFELKPVNINGPRKVGDWSSRFQNADADPGEPSSIASFQFSTSSLTRITETTAPYRSISPDWPSTSAELDNNFNQNYKKADYCMSDSEKEGEFGGSLMQEKKSKPAAYCLSSSDSDGDFDELPPLSNIRKSNCLEEANADIDEDIGWPPKNAATSRSNSEDDFDLPSSQQSLRSFHPLSDSEESNHAPVSFLQKEKDAGSKKTVNATKQRKEDSQDEPGVRKGKKRRTPAEIAEAQAAKDERKQHKEELRRTKPGHCLKHLVMEVDPALTNIPALSAVLLAPPVSQLRHTIKERDIPFSVGWYRELMPDSEGVPRTESSDKMLQLLEMDMMANLVHEHQLSEHVNGLLESQTNIKKLTIVVFGSKQYFRDRTGKKKKGADDITRDQLEEAIVECQIEMGVTFRLLETAQEVCEWLYRYSKAIAENPYKMSKQGWQESFRFYLKAEKGPTVRVTATGQGLPQLWVQVLRKFRRAPLETCQAIAAVFPSPAALIAAYEACDSVKEARDLLQNILVQRGAGVMAVQRRVGPNLSRKIHAVLTSTEPATLLSEVA